MITASSSSRQSLDWRSQIAAAFRDLDGLLKHLQLTRTQLPQLASESADFPLLVTHHYANQIQPGSPDDPLLLQVLPLATEQEQHPDFLLDPVGDLNKEVSTGVIHKYQGRVLFIATPACAIHCRYCFRRHYPYNEHQLSPNQWQAGLDYIAANDSIHEVILSGGDPLVLGNKRLFALLDGIEAIPHVRRLRIHSRLSVVLPDRIEPQLLQRLQTSRLSVSLVTHVNHARELSAESATAHAALRQHGVTLLNQSVLLRSVNNNADTLCTLSEALFEQGILPYYLHQLDKVQGAQHFETADSEALDLWQHMQNRLPGYLLPKLVRELPDEASKTPIFKSTSQFTQKQD